MRIENSTISMNSSRYYKAEAEVTQTTITRYKDANVDNSGATTTVNKVIQETTDEGGAVYINCGVPEDIVDLGGNVLEDAAPGSSKHTETVTQQNGTPQRGETVHNGNPVLHVVGPVHTMSPTAESGDWLTSITDAIEKDPKIQMMRKMLDLLNRFTGRKSSFSTSDLLSKGTSKGTGQTSGSTFHLSASAASMRYQSVMAEFSGELKIVPQNQNGAVNGTWTRQTIESAFVKGEEHTAFSSVGTVQTADGRTIDFGMTVEMSRSFEEAYEIVGQETVFTDPLVINLDTDAAALSDVNFYFDLNGDGVKEEMSGLGSGSGFLALDKNGDGEINDGSELFGAKTGNGFAELAQYDQDRNGWIDENDEVFSKLSVWVKCGTGDAKLLSLADAGVGAIFLGSQATDYSLTNSSGEVNAKIRSTGVYLKENGQAGTIQHVDFKG